MIYSIAEFRAKTRELLNKVDSGDEVLIERYGKLYHVTRDSIALVAGKEKLMRSAADGIPQFQEPREEERYVPDTTIEGIAPRTHTPSEEIDWSRAKRTSFPNLQPTQAPIVVSRSEAKRIAVMTHEPVVLTEKNRDLKFCKHGAVVGFCKKGCK